VELSSTEYWADDDDYKRYAASAQLELPPLLPPSSFATQSSARFQTGTLPDSEWRADVSFH
jgi:hypothetical protein